MKKDIVVKIGGSLLFNEKKELNSAKIIEFCEIIKSNESYNKIVIVCGGGVIARDYINTIRKFNTNEALCDLFGIELSRINSRLLISCLGDTAYPQVPKTIEELSVAQLFKKIIVLGGLQPGQSTTSVAMEVTEYLNAEGLIILTDVKGIYDKDPKKYKDAKLLKKLNYSELQNIIVQSTGDKQAAAGEYRIFDAVSLQILKRSNLNIYLVSGQNLGEFRRLWNGEKEFIGTLISN